jgi:outer membrane protein OmpA-like peptidoglycan-associated protein/tetratricopeptide (TPR) repeat protein
MQVNKLVILFLFISQCLLSQKSLKKQAEVFIQKKNYVEALRTLESYKNINKDKSALFNKGVCLYHLNKQQDCINAMKSSFDLGNLDNDIFYYTAKSYQELANFKEATVYYKNYLKSPTKDVKKRNYVIQELKRCGLSEKISFLPQIAYIENFGVSVNSVYDEICPLQSKHFQNKFYFSSNREGSTGESRSPNGLKDNMSNQYFYDMFATELSQGNYTPVTIFQVQNTPQNEVIQDFSSSGDIMYYLRYNSENNCRFIADTFTDSERLAEGDFTSIVKPTNGDKDFSFFNDSVLIFASNSLEGYGGYDIFGVRSINGVWQEPVNLGPNINSKYDETAPYITRGGGTIFFSSNDINGYGGADIFASQYITEKKMWSSKINLGLPINSTKDDIDPIVSNDGSQILLASNRIESIGGFDLYIAYLKDQLGDQFAYTETLPFFENALDSVSIQNNNTKIAEETKTIVKKSFLNTPMYYTSDEDVFSAQNNNHLKNLKTILDVYPEINVNIIGHSGIDPQKDQSLFFTIKRVERISSLLIAQGLDPKRIKMHSYGSSFPIVLSGSSRQNSRIEFILDGHNPSFLEILNDNQVLNQDLINPAYEDFLKYDNGLIYKIKVATTKQMIKNELILEFPYFSIYKNSLGDYEYYTGYKTSFEEANQLKITMQNKGITNASIVPFINHTLLSKENVSQYLSMYPDLAAYIKQ